ncbi:MAG: hypothetical protein DRN00_03490, partial [Thermoplasmata archaeon]
MMHKFSKAAIFVLVLFTYSLLLQRLVCSQYEEVTVHKGEDIIISVLVTNEGDEPQEDWMTGIEVYKVSDYSDPKNTRISDSRIYAIIKYVGTSPIQCRDAHDVPIPLEDCYCYIVNPIGTEILGPEEEAVNITCVIKSSFWSDKWGSMKGNERIMPWVHETIDEKDFDGNGYEWFWDALKRQDPAPIMIKTVEGPKAEIIDLDVLEQRCDKNGNFSIIVKNTGDVYLSDLKLYDTLWVDDDGDPDIGNLPHPLETKVFSVSLDPGQTSTLTWETSDPLASGKYYFHVLTLNSSTYGLLDKKVNEIYSIDGWERTTFYKSFRCAEPEEYPLYLEAKVDRTGIGVPACYQIYNESGDLKDSDCFSGEKPPIYLPAGNYSIKAYPVELDEKREFSHFWDNNCNGLGSSLDTGVNPYWFHMYEGEKKITIFYKPRTYITRFWYNGTYITGRVVDDTGYGILDFFSRWKECGDYERFYQNTRVDLYYEKDGKWYLIGSPKINYSLNGIENRDGSFIQKWECFPGVKRIKAVYTPAEETYAVYMPSVEILDYNCEDAECIGIYFPDSLYTGQEYKGYITMKNTGRIRWNSNFKLMSMNPPGNKRWGVSEKPSSPVDPDYSYTFELNITAPSLPGDYPFEWRMVDDKGRVFGQTCKKIITVEEPQCTADIRFDLGPDKQKGGWPVTFWVELD